MKRPLFCSLSPGAYRISRRKGIILRALSDIFSQENFAHEISDDTLPYVIYRHSSLIRRRLGNTDMRLQDNKAVNLSLAASGMNGLLIRPGETFSFWKCVGVPDAARGFLPGLMIVGGKPSEGVGGGLCQLSNLLHWMVLHTPMRITEHHHHDGCDLFPDYGRQIPFGTGTSVAYNYIDYRFKNTTELTFRLTVFTNDTHLCGELRADGPLDVKYHITAEGERFAEYDGEVYREGRVWRETVDKRTGNTVARELLRENRAKVMYDTSSLDVVRL